MSFALTLRQHKLPVTWDCCLAVMGGGSQVQLFISFWQTAKFIIGSAAEERRVFGGKSSGFRANTGLFILLLSTTKSWPETVMKGKSQSAAAWAAAVLRNLKPAVIHRSPKPENHLLQADLFVLDGGLRGSRHADFPRVSCAHCVQTKLQRAG